MRNHHEPWFAPTWGERCVQVAADRARRRAVDVLEAAFDEWMRGGNPVVDMENAERFIIRSMRRNNRLPLVPPADLIEHFRRWDGADAGDLLEAMKRAAGL